MSRHVLRIVGALATTIIALGASAACSADRDPKPQPSPQCTQRTITSQNGVRSYDGGIISQADAEAAFGVSLTPVQSGYCDNGKVSNTYLIENATIRIFQVPVEPYAEAAARLRSGQLSTKPIDPGPHLEVTRQSIGDWRYAKHRFFQADITFNDVSQVSLAQAEQAKQGIVKVMNLAIKRWEQIKPAPKPTN